MNGPTDEQIESIIEEQGGGADVLYHIGVELLTHEDPRCKTYLERSAKLGSDDALFQIGQLHLHGNQFEKDYDRAFTILNILACKDHVESEFIMGIMFGKGDGVPPSNAFSKYWYWLAAMKEHEKAIKSLVNLGWVDDNAEIVDDSDAFQADHEDFKALGICDRELMIERIMWAKFKIGEIETGNYNRPYGCVHVAPKEELVESHFYLAQNIDNLISKRMGVRFYDGEEIFLELNYGDLCMLKLRGGHLRDYPSGIEWSRHRETQESFPDGFVIDEEFSSTSEFIEYDETGKEPLFPFESRSIIKEMMENAGISEPKYCLIKTKVGVLITFNIIDHCEKLDNTSELLRDWGAGIQWILPKCYSLFFVDDKIAVNPL